MRARAMPAWLGSVLAAWLLAGGCETIVPSDLPPYTCSGTDPTVCPVGMHCVGSSCVACSTPDCSESSDGGGGDVVADATDATVNDSTETDTATEGGPQDSTAAEAPADVAVDSSPIPEAGDGGCPGSLGCPCTTSAQCTSGICGDSTLLTSSFTSANGSLCTTPCCTAGSCPAGFVCFGPGTGGNYCVPAPTLGRPAVLGSNLPGANCAGDGDCRSGKCLFSQCVDTCCADTDCTNGTVCSVDSSGLDGHQVFACLPHSGSAAHQSCTSSSQCASNDCDTNLCRPHCCNTASCAPSGFHACELDVLGSDDSLGCTYPSSSPTGATFGQPCTTYTDCVSRACNQTAGTCTEHCCLDSDCAPLGNYVCRPAPTSPYYLLCVPP